MKTRFDNVSFMARRYLLIAGFAAGLVSLPFSSFAREQVPFTAEELANELGIHHQRWKVLFDSPVIARMWIIETTDGKPASSNEIHTSDPSKEITFEVLVREKDSRTEDLEQKEIGVYLQGQADGEGSRGRFSQLPHAKHSSWRFGSIDNVEPVALDHDFTVFRWEQEAMADQDKTVGQTVTSKKLLEVKLRFEKAPPASPSPAAKASP